MRWFEHLAQLVQNKTPVVMVTLLSVRGHAPREAGAKMLVTAEATYGSIGGGNLEQTAIARAREILLGQGNPALVVLTARLTEKAAGEFGVQCCGGEVEVLLERVDPARAAVAIFGVGHVGLALARILSLLPIELYLIDSRAELMSSERLYPVMLGEAQVQVRQLPILDGAVGELPAGTHLVIMTHDHAEDLYVLEMALRRADLGYIGLIGSRAKWARFRQKLLEQGFSEEDLARVSCPIGLPGVPGKSPEAIAIATAAQLMGRLGLEADWSDPPLPKTSSARL
ncbi:MULTISPECIES: xanthine dehydrogenase accessory protein XdhC [unclassified Meiothermus]|uniref:xanthine dehydrogenase accessory protein XdhC n=1 Tax=unclassified Meiothermus TaxID=370471 RepID=UPI000D7C55A7|nr:MULTISPECIES: xanthine dehydrogenase accessory protein XdhC [unclassified Meiothermus]PZA08413.1 xanthine dehydrogenase accessory protein XdhC [Meiothermus sp. Pnk-1]RYM37080.1 xanthine dehydrogenase accessory protein XdhC [Meiothermus sp. PNK-Is4]